MSMTGGNAFFWPYDSIDDFFRDRTLPEFGLVPSLWRMPLESWQFYFAENRDMVPHDFASLNPELKGWMNVTLPSVWQQQGFGFPSKLLTEDVVREQNDSFSKKVRSKLSVISGADESDEVGIYRTWVQFSPAYLDRAVYFHCSGICGRFSFFVNGDWVAESEAVFSPSKILLSPYLVEGKNLITIMVHRLDDHKATGSSMENGTFGFSGIFRMPEIVAESLVEMSGLTMDASAVPNSGRRETVVSDSSPIVASETSVPDSQKADGSLELGGISPVAVDLSGEAGSIPVDSAAGLPQDAEADGAALPEQGTLPAEDVAVPDVSAESGAVKALDVSGHDVAVSAQTVTSSETAYSGSLRCSVAIKSHVRFPITLRCIPSVYAVLAQYNLYDLPELSIPRTYQEFTIAPNEERELVLELDVGDIAPWSHETPFLYDLVLTLTDEEGRVICVKRKRFGFRTAKVDGGNLFVNQKKVFVRGVRYSPFDPVTGLAVSLKRMRQDVVMMKRAGLNTVFHAGFAPDPLLSMLCDKYGLYLVCQARMKRFMPMWRASMSHPCVVMWSFSKAGFDEVKAQKLKKTVVSLRDGRPFFFEGAKSKGLSDFSMLLGGGVIYGMWNDIAIDVETMKQLGVRWTLPERGHQTRLLRGLLERDCQYVHQADLEEVSDAREALVSQGLVDPHRKPYPIYLDVSKQCENLLIWIFTAEPETVMVKSKNLFGSFPELTVVWQLLLDGRALTRGEEFLDGLGPEETAAVKLPFQSRFFTESGWMKNRPVWMSIYAAALKKELMLDVRIYQREGSAILPENAPLAAFQQILLEKVGGSDVDNVLVVQEKSGLALSLVREQKAKILSTPASIGLVKGPLLLNFSRRNGGLSALQLAGQNFFAGSMQPSFFRAAANPDRADSSFVMSSTIFSKESDWRQIQQNLAKKTVQYEMQGGDFVMSVAYGASAFKGDILAQYVMSEQGELRATLACVPKSPLPRMGFRVLIPKDMYRFVWYGRGPGESYPDRKAASPFGFYEGIPEDMYQPYTRPQENAAHADTQYLLLLNHDGTGIRIHSLDDEGFSFTVAIYSPEMLDDSPHQEELEMAEHYELFLDFYQRGVERTGKEAEEFVKNTLQKGTFVFEAIEGWA